MKMVRSLLILTLGIALMTGCGFFGGKSSKEGKKTERGSTVSKGKLGKPNFNKPFKPKFKIPVTVERVTRGRMFAYLQARGTVVPIKELEIKPEMSGRIYYTQKWLEGDEVKKDEILARMDARELNRNIELSKLQLESAKAEINPASANLAQAYKDEAFKKAMFERGAISKYEYDQSILARIQRKNAFESTLKSIRSRTMELQRIKQDEEKVPVTIPYSGVLLPARQNVSIAQRSTEETDLTLFNGQTIAQGTILCRLANIDQVYVALDVPAKDLVEVEIGQEVELEVYTKSAMVYIGKVGDISTALNSTTRTYTVNVLVENPQHELRPGMFAKARIITEERLDSISIPRELVLLRNNRQVIFVAKEKPIEEEVKSATDELKLPQSNEDQPSNKKIPLADNKGFEKTAAAAEAQTDDISEEIASATGDIADATDEEMFDEEEEPIKEQEPDLIAEERVVSVGIENRENIEITEGLNEGDLLVVLGYETLTDDIDINITIRDAEFLGGNESSKTITTPEAK
jgi:RND family efflux transporter MFP subunit